MRITLIGPLLALCVVASSSAHAVERGPASMPQPNPMAVSAGVNAVDGATPGWRQQVNGSALPKTRRDSPNADNSAMQRSIATQAARTGLLPILQSNPPFAVPGLDAPPSAAIDWKGYAAAGYKFAFIKASEGTYYVNPNRASQESGLAAAGLTWGVYHFANPGSATGAEDANYFLANGGGWSPGRLPGVLDIEWNPYSGNQCFGKSHSEMISWIREFNATFFARTKRYPIIYTATDWWRLCTGDTSEFSRHNPLWIAHWTTHPGQLPAGYTSWEFWQTGSDSKAVVDYNAFHGTLAQLHALARDGRLPNAQQIGGADRSETAALIAQRVAPRTLEKASGSVYLAREDVLVDALAAGTLPDGPILLVPKCSGLPAHVKREIERVNPARVVALGGSGSVCDATLAQAAGSRSTGRLGGADRFVTSVHIAVERHRISNQRGTVYLAAASDNSPDAIAGGQLTDGSILLVPSSGAVPSIVSETVKKLQPARVVALGGTGTISPDVLASTAGDVPTTRLAGADRYATSVAIAESVFPKTATISYLADGQVFADAVASGGLSDGPIVLVPPCGTALAPQTTLALKRWAPLSIVPLGGPGTLCPSTVQSAVAAASR